ncbi:hypothetical protein ANCDUO_20386 [Ancylostoma duodenale]|uniref:Uncharacterized protein n=1 Tax=Ancylostoma duodenale TaxID=51022 RepID=A0A0C2FSA7_9BILA|nr:hypothetical protein ANCDUO_20386 [Ancylostoma duodenale]
MRGISENGTYPAVLAVISPIRNAVFYLDLARTILKYIGRSRVQLTNFLSSIVQHSYPQNRGKYCEVFLPSKNTFLGASLVVVEKCATGWPIRIEIFNQGTILGRTGCSQVIERISPEITTCIVASLLGEQRILLADNTVCVLSIQTGPSDGSLDSTSVMASCVYPSRSG